MISQSQLLARTLVQRGESDNYIQTRLVAIGLDEDAAKQLIHEIRLHSQISQMHLMTETEAALLIVGSVILLVLFAWTLLVIF